MTKKQQIEQMARTTCQMYCRQYEKRCAGVAACNYKCLHYQRCEALYETGYRKQSEGEWIPTYTYTAEGTGIYKCSLCGRKSANPKADNFCPNCGAEMKGGE